MENLTVNQAMDFLKEQGYYINNLYMLEDVTNYFDITDEGAEKVLDATFNNEYVSEEINLMIRETAEAMGFSYLEDED